MRSFSLQWALDARPRVSHQINWLCESIFFLALGCKAVEVSGRVDRTLEGKRGGNLVLMAGKSVSGIIYLSKMRFS